MNRLLAIGLMGLLFAAAVRVPLCEHLSQLDVHWGGEEKIAHCHAHPEEAGHPHASDEDTNHAHSAEHPACPGGDCCDEIPEPAFDLVVHGDAEAERNGPAWSVECAALQALPVASFAFAFQSGWSTRPPPLPLARRVRATQQVFTI